MSILQIRQYLFCLSGIVIGVLCTTYDIVAQNKDIVLNLSESHAQVPHDPIHSKVAEIRKGARQSIQIQDEKGNKYPVELTKIYEADSDQRV